MHKNSRNLAIRKWQSSHSFYHQKYINLRNAYVRGEIDLEEFQATKVSLHKRFGIGSFKKPNIKRKVRSGRRRKRR